ncbi:MAG: DUF86 domain-containing protein [candidate division WOR-3 bacterium]
MPKRDWRLFIEDILEALSTIQEYVKNMDFEGFTKDKKTIDAVVRNLEIMGEAARCVPDYIKEKFPDVDWRGMIGFRNRIAHAYFDISKNIVWYIVANELPQLKEKMVHILTAKEK